MVEVLTTVVKPSLDLFTDKSEGKSTRDLLIKGLVEWKFRGRAKNDK